MFRLQHFDAIALKKLEKILSYDENQEHHRKPRSIQSLIDKIKIRILNN